MMSEPRAFVLTAFPDKTNHPAIALNGSVTRHSALLRLTYSLTGKLSDLTIPQPEPSRDRRDNLWQTACFECFLTSPDTSTYREFNLSPSGCWNVYRFSHYREGMKEETAIATLPFQIRKTTERLRLDVEIDLSALLMAEIQIQMAIAAVIQIKSGELSYWALHHPAERADFHAREGFVLEI